MVRLAALAALGVFSPAAWAQKDVMVKAPTRLDWQFACRGFGADAAKIKAGFDSTKQKYQLFVPKNYKKDRAWPLVLFISPGDGPTGWAAWKDVCEKEGVLFASPYAAGNSVPAGQRTRIILDALDDVRRAYRIDPDQTYVSGFSGGGRMACAIGFALPEYFGGIAPVGGTNPLSPPTYLRFRALDRLSLAFITGEKDSNRKENEVYMHPWMEELGIRSKLWVADGVGHAIPGPKVMAEVYAYLAGDLKRRQEDRKKLPGLNVKDNEAPAATEQAQLLLDAAEAELNVAERVWRGVTLVQGVVGRWPSTPAGKDAKQRLALILKDEKILEHVEKQGAQDEQKSLAAQASALERFGQIQGAIQAWELLAENYPDTPLGRQAMQRAKKLRGEKK